MSSTARIVEDVIRNAEPGRRLIAFIVDFFIFMSVIFSSAYLLGELNYTVRTQGDNSNIAFNVPWNAWSNLVGVSVLGSFWLFLGTSPGKKLMKIAIRDRASGNKPNLLKVMGRLVFYVPSMFVACIPFLQVPLNKEYRAWYDAILGLDVIDLRTR
jgi:uncharacterized RDD family membrane protein YckC